MKSVACYLRAHVRDDVGEGPDYLCIQVGQDWIDSLRRMSQVIKENGWSEIHRHVVIGWQETDTRIRGEELVVSGGVFWLTSYEKYNEYKIESEIFAIDWLQEQFDKATDAIFEDDDLRQLIVTERVTS